MTFQKRKAIQVNRIPSATTLELVEAMASDPKSTKALRDFHAANLVGLKQRRRTAVECRPSPFSRFADALENKREDSPIEY